MSFISVIGPVSSRCVVACHVLCCRWTPMVLRAKCDAICRRCGINLFSEKRQDAQGNQNLFDKGTCFPKTIRCYLFKRDSVWESPLFKFCRTVTSVIDCLSEDCHRHEKMLACITNGCGRYKCLFQSLTARNVSIGKAHFRTRLWVEKRAFLCF